MLPRFDHKDRAVLSGWGAQGRRGGGPLEPAGMGLPRNATFAGQSRFPARRLQTNSFLRRAPQDAPDYGGTNLPQLGKRNIPSHTVSVYSAVRPRCSTTPYNARVLQPPNRLPPSSTQRLPEEGEAAKPVPPSKPKAPAALAYTSRPRTQGTAMMPGRMGLATPSYAPLAGSKPLPGHGRNTGYSQGGVRAWYGGTGSTGPSFKPPKAKAHAPRHGYPETGPPSTAPLHTMDPHHLQQQQQQQHAGRSLTQRELLLQRELGFNSNPRASLATDALLQPRSRFALAAPPNFGLSRGGAYGGAHAHHPTVVGSRKQRPTSARRSHRGRNPPPPSKASGGGPSHVEQTLAYARGGAGAPRPPPATLLPSSPGGAAGGAATFHYGQQPQWPSMHIREPKQGYPRATPKPQLQTFPPTGTKTSAAATAAARDNSQPGGAAAETTLNPLAGAGARGAGAGAAPVGAQRVAAHGIKPATSPSPSPGPKAKAAPLSAPLMVDDDVPPVVPSTAPLSAAPAVAPVVVPSPSDLSPPPSPKPKAAAKVANPLEQVKLVEEVRKAVRKALREGQEDSEVLAALRSKAADCGLPPTDAVFKHLDDMSAAARVPLQRAQLPARVLDLVPLPEDHSPVNRVLGRYELSKVVGEGAYGRVMMARDTETAEGRPVAIKEFKVSDDDPDAEEVRRTSRREVALLKVLNHPHIVKYLNEFYDQENKLFVVMEFVPRNLLEVLEAHAHGLSADVVRRCMWQLCKAMCFIHKQDIVYRDIKPENLLIDPDGTLKLCDFGFARKVSSEHTVLTDYVATRWYRAPELLLGPPFRDDNGREVRSPYGKAVDMWAVGCLMGELTDGEPMFAGDSDLDQLARIQRMQGRLTTAQEALFLQNPANAECELGEKQDDLSLKYGDKVDPTSLDFMRGLLVIDPKSRLTAEDALRHPYFQSLWQD